MLILTLSVLFILIVHICHIMGAQTINDDVVFPTQEPFTNEIKLGDMWDEDLKPWLEDSENWFRKIEYRDIVTITISDGVIIGATLKNSNFKNINEFEATNYLRELKTSNGKFRGKDNGEWGGNVRFFPHIGFGYKLLDDNFRGFYTVNNRSFVLTGLSHMFSNAGCLYELKYYKGKWHAELKFNFESTPKAYLVVDDIVYLITDKSLYKIVNGDEIEIISDNAFWSGLSPNSMILANSKLYVGIKGGMFSIGLDNKTETWHPIK